MNLARKVDFSSEKMEMLQHDYEKADQRYRSYRLIRNEDRIETVFERLKQERNKARDRLAKALLEMQTQQVAQVMSQKDIALAPRISQAIQKGSLRGFCYWLWHQF